MGVRQRSPLGLDLDGDRGAGAQVPAAAGVGRQQAAVAHQHDTSHINIQPLEAWPLRQCDEEGRFHRDPVLLREGRGRVGS